MNLDYNRPDVSDKYGTFDNNYVSMCQSSLLNNFINVNIGSLSMHAMIDTGADISVANPSILSKLDSVGINVVVKPSDKKVIITANDEHVEIVGTINVDLKVGDESSDVKFYLVPCLTPQLILGLDFLNHQGAVIDFNAQKISFDPRRVLIAKSDITVPPKSEVVIAAKIKGAQLPENVLGLASESLSLASRGLLAANSIAHVSNGTVMHGLCNIFDKPIKIKKNSNVGKFVCISRDDKLYDIKLENTQQVGGVNNKRDIDLPDVSRDLKVEERGQLNDLLRKYSDVFVNKEGKLGQCDVIEHEIHIPDTCKPIRQRPYKLGAKQKEVLENVVSDMLKDGIIEPSTSPWAAPCLLVAKKSNNTTNTDYRFVVDYRRVNECIELNAHPLLTTEDALESVGAKQPTYFSALDLKSGFYQSNYAKIASPLYALTKKNVDFIWTEQCENAFKLLREALISPPLLAYPDFDEPFQLYTDASSFALGAVLCQTQNGTERVICYSGRSLSKQEQQYGITEKECLALVYAVKKFDCYLRFTKFTAYVDHSALKWLLTLKEPTGKFARWIALLQSYSMEILYRPGTTHGNADGVSRREYENVTDQDMESLIDILPYGAVIDKTGNNVKIVKKHSPFVRNITDNDNIEIDNTTKESVNMFPMAQLKVEQRKDTYFKNIITFLESGELPENAKWRRNILTLQPFYFINDGILYHINKKYKRHCKDTEVTIQIAVPRKLVPVVLKETHDGLLSGHLGINRTIQRTQRSFFWPSIGSDVAEWVKSCELCSQRKRPQKPTKSPISSMPIASQPFERVSTDILGPVSNSGKSKNQYVLVFICYLTKYVELIPLSDIKAATIATAFLHNVVCRHGTPLFLHSDRGVNYLSNIVKETCKLLDIKKTQTTSYRPQCNGQSERMMSTIKDMLSKYIEDNSDWDRYIPFIQFAYNTSPSIDSTDYSPFFLVNGRHPKSFLDTHLPNMEVNVTAREYIVQTLENIEKARAVARENLQEHKTEMLNKANRNRENSNFSVGDIVYLYTPATTPNLSRKLRRPWTGPFYIVERLSKIHVRLRRKCDGKLLKTRVHVDRIKPGFVWTGEPRDPKPPPNELEPLEIHENDIPGDNFEQVETDVQPSQVQ
ncbi:unnamed protein product [Mytilus edulis]|uniref:RNA-directed DNA polymerase n=1 Tax=Mytilus edulis TaxID=6550 RepID=A0A8S3QQD9_MYTED|nr:unnamed protein product [Mytilus edulis]